MLADTLVTRCRHGSRLQYLIVDAWSPCVVLQRLDGHQQRPIKPSCVSCPQWTPHVSAMANALLLSASLSVFALVPAFSVKRHALLMCRDLHLSVRSLPAHRVAQSSAACMEGTCTCEEQRDLSHCGDALPSWPTGQHATYRCVTWTRLATHLPTLLDTRDSSFRALRTEYGGYFLHYRMRQHALYRQTLVY